MNQLKTNLTVDDICTYRDVFLDDYLGIRFYDYQREASNKIIHHILNRTGEEIPIEFSRQSGKTEMVVDTAAFLMAYCKSLTARFWGKSLPIRIVIFAPQKEQAKTDFDRLKNNLNKLATLKKWKNLVDKKESNQTTLQINNGSYCYIFPLTPLSNPESKTADLLIFEEAHKIIDLEKKVKAEPMGASTNAPEISIGVSGFTKNYFKKLIDKKKHHLRYPAERVVEERQKRYEEDGDVAHLLYAKKFNKILTRDGADDIAVKTQWLLKWHLEAGQFMTADDWEDIRKPYKAWRGKTEIDVQCRLVDEDLKNDCYVGIDTAKDPDSTVVTVIRWNEQTQWKELVALLELHGTNYADQFTIVSGFDTVEGRRTGLGLFDSFKVVGLAIDSTGQGDFFPDMFSRHTKYKDEKSGLFRVKFSLIGKDNIYTNLMQVAQNRLTALPSDDTLEMQRFENQMLDLEKEYKGQFLSCHHPEGSDGQGEIYHDDYPDSWALAEWAFACRQKIAIPKIRIIGG